MSKSIIPRPSADPNLHSREVVLQWLLFGSIGMSILALINTVASFIIFREFHLDRLLLICLVVSLFCFMLYMVRARKNQVIVSLALITLLFVAAGAVCLAWGTVNPIGVLLFALVIVMTGILVSARSSLYALIVAVVMLSGIEYAKDRNYFVPDLSWTHRSSDYSDIVSFSVLFLIIALVSWLFNRQMEHSLLRARKSERALQLQKASLEVKVAERTRELQEAQLEKVQHFYRFAELGNLSTALFHDLGNHLSSVTLDIEGLQNDDSHSKILRRIQRDVGYINDVVLRVRQQMQGTAEPSTFDVREEISEVMKILTFTARRASVELKLESLTEQPLSYKADIIRFRQLVINLLSNAIDAYPKKATKGLHKVITQLDFDSEKKQLIIKIIDHGKGIPKNQQHKIFEPFYSTKERGSGIGLFIVKQVVEKDLGGSIDLVSDEGQGTTFTVRLPG